MVCTVPLSLKWYSLLSVDCPGKHDYGSLALFSSMIFEQKGNQLLQSLRFFTIQTKMSDICCYWITWVNFVIQLFSRKYNQSWHAASWLQSIQKLDCSTVCCWALLSPHFLKRSTGWVSPDLIISIQDVFVCVKCKSHCIVPLASCSPDSFGRCNEAQDDWNVGSRWFMYVMKNYT